MSRAYRIQVAESINRVLKAEDKVTTKLELLEILPPEQMAGLLSDELEKRGFEKQGDKLVRNQNGVTVTVDPATAEVSVTSQASESFDHEGKKEGRAYDDVGPSAKAVRDQLKEELRKDLERKAEERTGLLQTQVTDKLEAELAGVRQELDQAVNKVTAEALKRKAGQMGQIKEMTEDPQTGSLTIVVEV